MLPCHNQLAMLYYMRDWGKYAPFAAIFWCLVLAVKLNSVGIWIVFPKDFNETDVMIKPSLTVCWYLAWGLDVWVLPGGHVRSRGETRTLPVDILESSLSQTVKYAIYSGRKNMVTLKNIWQSMTMQASSSVEKDSKPFKQTFKNKKLTLCHTSV